MKFTKVFLFAGILLVFVGFVYANDIIAKAGDFFVDGRLGIGDTTPEYKLDVEGNVSLNNTLTVNGGNVDITGDVCFGGCTNSSMYWDGDNLIIKVN